MRNAYLDYIRNTLFSPSGNSDGLFACFLQSITLYRWINADVRWYIPLCDQRICDPLLSCGERRRMCSVFIVYSPKEYSVASMIQIQTMTARQGILAN